MPELFLSLLLFAAATTFSPGGATMMVAASGARFGWRRSLPLLAGTAAGLATLVAAAAAGLAALIHAVPALELGLRAAGTAYLLWLAWRIARSGAPDTEGETGVRPAGFLAGYIFNLVNPKAWAMALGAAAAYAGLAAGPLALALSLATVFGLSASVALSLWCAGGKLLALHLRSARQWQLVNGGFGLLLLASIVPMWL